METKKTNKMNVYKFYSEEHFYAFSGKDEQEAKEALFEYAGEMPIDKVEQIPESEWDEKIIEMYEDNDTDGVQFFVSIREELQNEPALIFTNDDNLTS